jgi:putative effector of murein hydrolase LrgA (UPF0299 family)
MRNLTKTIGSSSLLTAASLLVLFGGGAFLARALQLPLPAPLAGMGLVLLALRLGVMAAAVAAPADTLFPHAREERGGRLPNLHPART